MTRIELSKPREIGSHQSVAEVGDLHVNWEHRQRAGLKGQHVRNAVSQTASRSRSARRLDQQARCEQRHDDVADYGEVIVLTLIDEALVEAGLHERLLLCEAVGEDDVRQQQTQRLFGHGETGLVGEAEILSGQEQPHHRHLD